MLPKRVKEKDTVLWDSKLIFLKNQKLKHVNGSKIKIKSEFSYCHSAGKNY